MTKPVYNAALVSKASIALLNIMWHAPSDKITDAVLEYSELLDRNGPTTPLGEVVERVIELRGMSRGKRWLEAFDAFWEPLGTEIGHAILNGRQGVQTPSINPEGNEALVLEVADALLTSKGLSSTTRAHQTAVGNYASFLRGNAATIRLDGMMDALDKLRDGSRVKRWREPFDAYLEGLEKQVMAHLKKAREDQASSKAYQEMMDASDLGDLILLSPAPSDRGPRKKYRICGLRSRKGVTEELRLEAAHGPGTKILNAHQLCELNAAFPPREKSQVRDDFESLQVGDVFRLDAYKHHPMPNWAGPLTVSSVHRRNPRRLRVNFKDTTGKTQIIAFIAWAHRNGRIVSRAADKTIIEKRIEEALTPYASRRVGDSMIDATDLFDTIKVGTVVCFTNTNYVRAGEDRDEWTVDGFNTGMHGERKIRLRNHSGSIIARSKHQWTAAQPVIVSIPESARQEPSKIPEVAKDRIMTAFSNQEVASSSLLSALFAARAGIKEAAKQTAELAAAITVPTTSYMLGDRIVFDNGWKGFLATEVFQILTGTETHAVFTQVLGLSHEVWSATYEELEKRGARIVAPTVATYYEEKPATEGPIDSAPRGPDLSDAAEPEPTNKVIIGAPTVRDLQRHIGLIYSEMEHRSKPEEDYRRFMFCANSLIDTAGRGSKAPLNDKRSWVLSRLAMRLRDATISYLADNPMTDEYAPECRAGLLLLSGLINPTWKTGKKFVRRGDVVKAVEFLDSRYELEKTRPSDL